MSQFPRHPEEITAGWLAEKLGAPVSDFTLEQIGVGVGLLGRLYRVSLTGHASTPATIIAKFPTLDEGARANVATPLGFYANEINFYNEAAALTPITTAKAFAAEIDPDTQDFVLLLEDLSDRRSADQTVGCAVGDAEVAVDALAGLHAHWWESDFAQIPWVKSYLVPPYPQVIQAIFANAWPVAREVLHETMPEDIRAFGDRFPTLVEWFLAEASVPPYTYCHGDFRLDNLFFGRDGEASVTVLDWQISFRGNAAYDLAYFLSQSLSTEDRRASEKALIDRYLGVLANKGVEVDRGAFDKAYARTVAYCFIYPIAAAGQIEVTNERHLALLHLLYSRSAAAIDDWDALADLPQ
ncbi:MAG TPA: phosphotransferase [Acidimicrobiales bacterium]|nr:phosphotransferase [Acidimicrobiales bacterium]